MKVIIYLMSLKGLVFLKALLKFNNLKIKYIVLDRDIFVDDDSFTNIETLCSKFSIPFFYKHKAPEILPNSIIIAISWRWIIDSSNSTVITIHDSILPKYRGFNPLVSALINGEKVIGATAIYANSEYDKGDIIKQELRSITYPITISEAIQITCELYIKLANFLANYLSSGSLPPSTPQNEKDATYSLWRNEDDYFINWELTSKKIKRFIDAVGSPYKYASSYIDKKKVKIIEANEYPDKKIENRCSGKVIFVKDGLPVVVCGKGLIIINKLEDEYGNSLLPLSKFRTIFKNHI